MSKGEGWNDIPDDVVVWLSVAKVEASFARQPDHYVGKDGIGNGQKGRYDHVGTFIKSGRAVFMPHLSLQDDNSISFTDGRHRFAWVRVHGATAIPVTIAPDEAERFIYHYGTTERECRVRW
jgi:hypothetical protein